MKKTKKGPHNCAKKR